MYSFLSEKINLKHVKKYLVAKKEITKGQKFTLKNIIQKELERVYLHLIMKKYLIKFQNLIFTVDESIKL